MLSSTWRKYLLHTNLDLHARSHQHQRLRLRCYDSGHVLH